MNLMFVLKKRRLKGDKIMLPKGFSCNGMHSGIAKDKNKKDLALFFSSVPAVVAGMFTGSLVKAAPVLTDIARLKKYKSFQAVIANSGCANACTGQRGKKDAEYISRETANNLISHQDAFWCVYGVIGNFLL
jgi:glutamate N-acetyltransferase/amino-acid N-acetyltransferase